MDVGLNVTITIDGFVELRSYRCVYCLLVLTAYALILCCNLAVVWLIAARRSLHQPMYVLIAALLLNSVLYSSIIYPKLFVDALSAAPVVSYFLCCFQMFVYYTTVGAEFLLLAAMAYDRHLSVCQPLRYPSLMGRGRVALLLLLAWLLPVCELAVSAVIYGSMTVCSLTLRGLFCNTAVYSLLCVRSLALSLYSAFLLFNLALLPLLFIVFTYARILLVSYRSCGAVRRKAAHTCLPHLLVLIGFSCFVTYDVVIVRLESDLPKTARLIMTFQTIACHPLFNPIIYGLKMREISKHLQKIFSHIRSHKLS